MKNSVFSNKRGDIASILFIVIFLVFIGFVFIMVNNLNHRLLTQMETTLENSEQFQNSTAIETTAEIRSKDDRVWDYAFLGIFMGCIIALGMTAYSTRVSPVFYWIYGILGLAVLLAGTLLSNLWQSMAETPEMVESIARFPITDFILGTYYPTIITAILILVMILLFGKTPDNLEGIA